MRERFYSNWHGVRVNEREDVPLGPHFQALVFSTRSEHTPAYSKYDDPGGTYSQVPCVDVYAFRTREELDVFVEHAARDGVSFVFYAVDSLGKASIKVDVEIPPTKDE